MSSPPARVYIVDDDTPLRIGVEKKLKDLGYQPQSFPSGEAFLCAHPKLLPGCILADLVMPNMSGIELQQQLAAAGCHWPVILLTGHASRRTVAGAVESGVIAYLEKPVRDAELLAALLRGEALLLGNAQMTPDPRVVQRMARLTPRERQVLELIMRQKLNKQIGAMLGIAETTVKGYRRALMSKVGATNTTELVLLAVRAGLYPPKS